MKNLNLEHLAEKVATEAHKGQFRKDFDMVPYIEHPKKVARTLCYYFTDDSALIASGFLHDVLEDCPDMEWGMLRKLVGEDVFGIVEEVTNPSKRFPELSRQEKKKMDREHIATISYRAKCLKLADRTDNLLDASKSPRKEWVKMYVEESMRLYTVLVGTHYELEVRFLDALACAGKEALKKDYSK